MRKNYTKYVVLIGALLLNGCSFGRFFGTAQECNRPNLANNKPMPNKQDAKAIRVISANVRFDFPSDKEHGLEWARRLPVLTSTLLKYKPDVIGIQEATKKQIHEILESCKISGSEFGHFGLTTNNTNGGIFDEHLTIMFNPRRFMKVSSGFHMLSDTPDVVSPEPGFGGMYTHALIWVKLRDRLTRQTIGFATTHFDPSMKAGNIRVKSAELLQRTLEKIFWQTPFTLMGDFNLFPDADGNEAYNVLAEIGDDIRNSSKRGHFGPDATFAAFKHEAKNNHAKTRLDHMFVNKLLVLSEGVIQHTTTPPASDHDFLIADLSLAK